jgi:superfamily II DNA or RNA helicase
MARPTLSKVLYLQQIGRGLRKTDVKKNVPEQIILRENWWLLME